MKSYEEFAPYLLKRFEDIEAGKLNPDVNLDGTFDYFDIVELADFEIKYKKELENSRYDAFETVCSTYPEDIQENYRQLYGYLFTVVDYMVFDRGIEYFVWYYLYNGSEYPEKDVLDREFSNYADGKFIGSEALEYFYEQLDFAEYAISVQNTPIEYPDWELEIFNRIDNGETDADFNSDGNIDYFDMYELMVHHLYLTSGMSIKESANPEIWNRVEANGDFDSNGSIEEYDYFILSDYYYNYKGNEFLDNEILKQKIEIYANGIYQDSVKAQAFYEMVNLKQNEETDSKVSGDANCDGKLTLADSVAILQYIANADKYPLTEQGRINADIYGTSDGITAADAIEVQKILS